jgi:potassium channel subfamily K
LGLALNVFANILLIIRFSSRKPWWTRNSTRLSLLFWLGKTIIALVNLILFGILTRNGEGYQYSEGFWCAVISVIDAGIITVALLFHYFFAFGKKMEDTEEVRLEGRKFMLSVTFFMGILAIQSLVFCKLEDWLYSDAICKLIQHLSIRQLMKHRFLSVSRWIPNHALRSS